MLYGCIYDLGSLGGQGRAVSTWGLLNGSQLARAAEDIATLRVCFYPHFLSFFSWFVHGMCCASNILGFYCNSGGLRARRREFVKVLRVEVCVGASVGACRGEIPLLPPYCV